MVSPGLILVSCILTNTILGLVQPAKFYSDKLCGWYRRIGKRSVLVCGAKNPDLFRNISRDISPALGGNKKTGLMTFVEEKKGRRDIFIVKVMCPGDSIFIDEEGPSAGESAMACLLGEKELPPSKILIVGTGGAAISGYEIIYGEDSKGFARDFLRKVAGTRRE